MSIRERFPQAKLPRSHYFLTVSRGDKTRAFALRPATALAALIAAPLMGVWACGATVFIACHDSVVTALVSREAQLQTEYETKLSDARAELDRMASRQLLDQNAFEGKMRDLVTRQARLESRGAALAALAAEASANATALAEAKPRGAAKSGNALSAIQAIGGPPTDGDLGSAGASGAASAYAPTAAPAPKPAAKPRPLDDQLGRAAPAAPDKLANELAAAAADASLDPNARVGLVGYSLDRVERAQLAALTGVAKTARAASQKFETIVQRTGLSLAQLKVPEGKPEGQGGPFIPVAPGDEAFARAVGEASKEIENARKLRRIMPRLPVRYPLIGDATLSSPFGYRADPFLGRPALHPGLDMVQAYGAEIKATAVGKVTHAGPMGGYGNCVEIDHGNGLTTRFGHMSEVLVEEGQSVKIGDAIGRIGSTGRSTGPHLHYEVRVDGEPVDPERFLTAVRD